MIAARPKIDTIELLFTIPDKDYYSFLWAQGSGIKDIAQSIVPQGKVTLKKLPYLLRTKFFHGPKRNTADVEVFTNRNKIQFFKLRLFPTRWNTGEFADFQLWMQTLYEMSYSDLHQYGKVTRLDIARDLYSMARERVIPYRSHSTISRVFQDGCTLGTVYIGSVHSLLRFRVYDKAAQQKGAPMPWPVWTRIEAVQRHVPYSCAGLGKLENPFSRFGLADKQLAETISESSEWKDFVSSCLTLGSPAAIAALPTKSKKKAFRNLLAECRFDWWKPEAFWKQWPQALASIAPAPFP
jgi:hypothetical protein